MGIMINGKYIKEYDELTWFEKKWFYYKYKFNQLLYEINIIIIKPFCNHKNVVSVCGRNSDSKDSNEWFKWYHWKVCEYCGKQMSDKVFYVPNC
jgi:hypothetical protein